MHTSRRQSSAAPRGAAALVVVMVLFFIMSLVAAYASRNLIFEQRTSANNYRSTQAFDAAEAGLEWAIAMLNGGRIDAACASTDDPTKNSFRERYLTLDPGDGTIGVRQWVNAGEDSPLLPSCVRGGSGWNCSCPQDGAAVLAAPVGATATPTFKLRFETVSPPQPGTVRVFSSGCSNFAEACLAGAGGTADANAEVNAVVGLAPALTPTGTPPAPPVAAAVTVRGSLTAADANFVNPDTNGIVVNLGQPRIDPLNVSGPPGMSASSAQGQLVADNDDSLKYPSPVGGMSKGEMMFLSTFGVRPAAFRVQPAVVRLSCGADCGAALQDAVARYPGRPIWIDGDLNLAAGAAFDLGSAAAPLLLVVDGDVNLAAGANVVLRGLVHVRGASWASVGATATVIGALLAEGDPAIGVPEEGKFTITGNPRIVFDAATVDHLAKVKARQVFDFGSFARVPGSWRDFR